MKSYFIRNVFNQIKSKKIETMIIFSIAFMMSIFLSLIYFFGYNDTMESNIANQLDLSYEMKKSYVYTKEQLTEFLQICDQPYEHYEMFTEWINETGNDSRISEYQYDLVLNLENENGIRYNVFGTDDDNYLKDKEMAIISGRFLTEEEIKNGSNYVVVSDQTYKSNDKVTYKVGDKIQLVTRNLSTGEYEAAFDVEVIGIYQFINQSTTFNVNDEFINSNGIIVPNKILDDYIDSKQNTFNFKNLTINHIKFTLKDYKQYENYLKDLETSIRDLNIELNQLGYPISKLNVDENNISEIIHSSSRIKFVYQVIFMLIFVIVAFVLIACIYYLLKKKTKEIAVYYSLGQPKIKITLHYFLTYLIISIFACIFGLIIGYIVSLLLMNNMAQDSIEMQNEILRFSMISILDNAGENAYIPTFTFTLSSCVKIFIEVTLIIGVSVIGSITIITKEKILSRNGGWN